MSYILDALKRADAERTRGAVPGLHTRPLASPRSADSPVSKQLLWWLAGITLLSLITALGLWFWPTPVQAPAVPTPAPMTNAQAVPPPPLSTAAVAQPTPIPAPAAPASLPAAAPSVAPTETVAPANTPAVLPPLHAVAKPVPLAPASTPNAAGTAHAALIPSRNELPEALRSQIPALTITGSVYSDDPHKRLLLINNQVLPQGSQAAPGVTLEEIQPHAAVFGFQDVRFRVTY
jgi:general secretion pathway protein B